MSTTNNEPSQLAKEPNIASNSWFNQSTRLLKHELRRGELTIIFLAIVLAVATVFSLTGFSGQIKHAILANSTNTIAADRVLSGSSEVKQSILDKSAEFNVKLARKIETESMVFAGDNMLLSELSAISNTYPLRGDLKVKTSLEQGVAEIVNAPPRGSIWVERSVLSRLGVEIGDAAVHRILSKKELCNSGSNITKFQSKEKYINEE